MLKTVNSVNKIWQQAYQGARKGSKESMKKLLDLTEAQIKSTSKVFGENSVDIEDLAQSAREYVLECVQKKKENIVNPEHYFKKGIYNTIKHNRLEYSNYLKRHDFLGEYRTYDSMESAYSKEFVAKHACNQNMVCYLKEVLVKISKMPRYAQRILLAPVFEKKSSIDLAKELKMSAANVDKIRERARKELAKSCEYFA